MQPVTVQLIVAMLAYALNERMARKAEYHCAFGAPRWREDRLPW